MHVAGGGGGVAGVRKRWKGGGGILKVNFIRPHDNEVPSACYPKKKLLTDIMK